MLLRLLEIGLVVLVLAAGIAALAHGNDLYSVVVLPTLLFLRGFLWRLGLRRGLVLLIVPLIPFALRHRGRRNLSRFGAHCHAVGRLVRRRWNRLPPRLRFVVAIASVPGFIAFLFPLRITATNMVGEWFQTRALPLLARTAAAHGLHSLFGPVLAEALPASLQEGIRRRYRRLWWRTMRQLVKDRQVLGRRTSTLPIGGKVKRNGIATRPTPSI